MRRALRTTLAAAFALVTAVVAAAAQTYPNRPVRLIVPFPPAGGNDVIARIVAPQVEAHIRQPVVIDNRSGANGIVGTQAVTTAAPDGYTLLHVSAGMIINTFLYKKLPYDVYADLAPIAPVAIGSGYVIVVDPKLPIHNVADLIAYAKTHDVFYGSSGPGSPIHLASEAFRVAAGVKVSGVQFRGTGPALGAIMASTIHFMFAPPGNVIGAVKEGTLRAIGFSGATPLRDLPAVPLVRETVPSFLFEDTWQGWFAPAKTSPQVIAFLNERIREAIKDEKLVESLRKVGYEPLHRSPEDFAKLMKADAKILGDAVKAANIEPQ